MLQIDTQETAAGLLPAVTRVWDESARKVLALERAWDHARGAPVFTIEGRYTTRGWTEWTQGFQVGAPLLQFDATGDRAFLDHGRDLTRRTMHAHVTHMGVHDHGFNVISTYGALLRLANEGRFEATACERELYAMALRCSGAVQARRWTSLPATAGKPISGFIYSFNGPHSLFADTVRTLRSLAVAHTLGHVLLEERDARVSLLDRLLAHAESTARYIVYYGEGRDCYDVWGRTAHECLFNVLDGSFRCPSTQQGYSPFSTWTRGQAWVMLGFAEQAEYIATRPDEELAPWGGRAAVEGRVLRAAKAACDHYIDHAPTDGVPYWDTGAPGLALMPDWQSRPADPFNRHEPVDSSAAAIGAQGLLRLGATLAGRGETGAARYSQAGLTVARTLFGEPYLSTEQSHQGLLLHSVYHRPNGWDHVPPGQYVPCGEASMWGDYHLRELALTVQRLAEGRHYTFLGTRQGDAGNA